MRKEGTGRSEHRSGDAGDHGHHGSAATSSVGRRRRGYGKTHRRIREGAEGWERGRRGRARGKQSDRLIGDGASVQGNGPYYVN